MGLKLEPKEGDTLLSPEELDQIIPKYITNRRQLDEVEQDNIEDAIVWVFKQRTIKPEKVFTREFQDNFHKKMLGKVWKWAGQKRTRETNIGAPPFQIEVKRKMLNDDALFWVQNNTWPPVELAIRFHHRLVQIHCYPNGNGRHSRIMADIILTKLYKLPAINWLGGDLVNESETRKSYIEAMKVADKGDYSPLFKCIRY
jgi:Fic-DOC domain mobile mystery protein B